MNRYKVLKFLKSLIYHLTMICFFIIIIFPFYFMIIISLKWEEDINIIPVKYYPSPATFQNYVSAWNDSKFALYFVNTVVVSLLTLVIVSVISLMSGYALSRYQFKGKSTAMMLFLISQMVPAALMIVPLFTIIQKLGLLNTLFSVALTTSANLLAYCSILMKGFFSNISVQLEQAAWIDGCSKLQAVIYVILPLVMPGLVATGAYAFVNAWNIFLYPLILLTNPDKFTLTLGLKSLIGQYTINYGRLSAAGVICLIPAILMFSYIQRHIVVGLSAGAIKG